MSIASSQRFAREYQKAQIETSRPTQLVLMLYDGAIRFLMLATDNMKAGSIEERHGNLLRAQRIVSELLSTLDLEKGGQIAANLQNLYGFMLRQLVEANLYDQQEPIADVIRLLRELRESWVEVDRMVQSSSGPGTQGANAI